MAIPSGDSNLRATASQVQWGTCESLQVFDSATGSNNPQPPEVGKEVRLDVDALFNVDVNVKGIKVDVQFTA